MYFNKPIVDISDIPDEALVVMVVPIGRPLIAEKKVKQHQFKSLDYYSFYKYSELDIKHLPFWDGFNEDFKIHYDKYNKIYNLLSDKISKNQFYNIINFRLSYDINYMRGFSYIADKQYFEDFLMLKKNGETFVDIGAYDGYTSEEFIRHCPDYKSVYLFEPEEKNLSEARDRLSGKRDISFIQKGLSSRNQTLKFDVSGSSSKISSTGDVTIEVDRLDNLLCGPVTFIKMDIEGAEADAIEGAVETIKEYHPKLALSVYHKANDFWKIPEHIFSIRDDYKIFLRHYTEGISETIMFFIPIAI